MGAFLGLVALFVGIGVLLGLGAHLFWQATGRFMLAIGSIAWVAACVASLLVNGGASFLTMLLGGTATGAALGCTMGFSARRLSIEEFLLLALALSELVRRLALTLAPITGGAYGLQVNASWPLSGGFAQVLIGVSVLGILWVLQRWWSASEGLRWRLVGGARRSAVLNGINPQRVETIAGALAGLAAGLAGILHANTFRYLHPDDLGLAASLPALAVGIAARPKSLLVDGLVLSGTLFGFREVLRLIGGSTNRFAVFDIVAGIVIVSVSLRLARTPNVR